MTERLFIVGHPVAHSKSPAMHDALYRAVGLEWEYGFADQEDDRAARTFIADRSFLGCNVTMPYKRIAFAQADVQAASAKLAGGANVVANKDGLLICYNVDGKGCIGFLELAGVTFADARVVVCGTGPTSLAIMHAAVEAGAADITLLGRDKCKAQERVDAYLEEYRLLLGTAVPMPSAVEGHLSFADAYEHANFRFGDYAGARRAIAQADVIVDATPLGMQPDDPSPFDVSLMHEGQAVMDVVYGHGQTALLAAARNVGARAFDGAGMLVAQAVDTAQIFFDIFGVECSLTQREMFDIMARGAGFALTV